MNGIQLLLKQNLYVADALADLFRVLSCVWVGLFFVRESFLVHQTASGAGVIDLLCADPFSQSSRVWWDQRWCAGSMFMFTLSCCEINTAEKFLKFPMLIKDWTFRIHFFYSALFAYQWGVTGTCEMPFKNWIFEYGILALCSFFREMAQFFPFTSHETTPEQECSL